MCTFPTCLICEDCGVYQDKNTELDLHHAFNGNSARHNNERVNKLLTYIKLIGNPFLEMYVAANVVKFDIKAAYKHDWWKDTSRHFYPFTRSEVMPKPLKVGIVPGDTMQIKIIKSKNDAADLLLVDYVYTARFIDYCRERSYDADAQKLLKHEITLKERFVTNATQ